MILLVAVTDVTAVDPLKAVTVNVVRGLPPLSAGAENSTVAELLPAMATTFVGAPG